MNRLETQVRKLKKLVEARNIEVEKRSADDERLNCVKQYNLSIPIPAELQSLGIKGISLTVFF